MKFKWAFWDILLVLGVLLTGGCAQSSITPVSLPAEEITPTETSLGGEPLAQASPEPSGADIQGSIDFIFIYAIYHPDDADYSATINVPFHVNRQDPPYTDIVGGTGSVLVSDVEEVEDCPIDIDETFNVRDLRGSLLTDDQGNFLLDFTYQTNNLGEYYVSCDDITLPLGGSEWSENEVTLPAIDGYEYIPSPDAPVMFILHLNTQP
jgi:hypothetical protein